METRKLNHALANLHGFAQQLAWLDFATCMVQLAEVHGSAFVVAWLDLKSPILASKITLAIRRKSIPQPPRQEVLRLLVPRQIQHPRHAGEDVSTIGKTAKPRNFGKRISPLVSENAI